MPYRARPLEDRRGVPGNCALSTGSGFAGPEEFGHRVLDDLT